MLKSHWIGASAIVLAAAGIGASAEAASITYALDQSNADTGTLIDGTTFATLTIDDHVANALRFTITLSPTLTSIAGSNFGIDGFAFNVIGTNSLQDYGNIAGQWTLPSGWDANVAPPPNQSDGFGRFDAAVDGTGSNRQTTLVFSLNNTALTLYSFAELSANNAGQGSVFFSAHVAGFNGPNGITSAYIGGSSEIPAVPLPAALPLLLSGLAGFGLKWRVSPRKASGLDLQNA